MLSFPVSVDFYKRMVIVDPRSPRRAVQGSAAAWNSREIDPSFLLPMREVGRSRTHGLRNGLRLLAVHTSRPSC